MRWANLTPRAGSRGRDDAARLHRRMWRCRLGMFAALLLMVLPFAFWQKLNLYVQVAVLSMYVLTQGVFLLVGNVTWLELIHVRCPRCDKHFITPFGLGFLRRACKHCGLDLGPAVIDKTKPPGEVDLWE